jgi:hypothetical protein
MVDEGLLTQADAVMRIEPAQLDRLLHPTLDPNASLDVLGHGLAASPGARRARSYSMPTKRPPEVPPEKTSSSFAGRRAPTTSTA